MSSVESFTTSREITSELVAEALRSPQTLKAFVARLAEVARPEQGFTRVFKVLVTLATASWMEGDLQVDFLGDDKGTTLSLYAVLGVGIRERLFAPTWIAVPIDEFQRAIVLDPSIVSPLEAQQGLNRMILLSGAPVPTAVPEFELEDKALGDGERTTSPPPAPGPDDPSPEVYTRPTAPPPDVDG